MAAITGSALVVRTLQRAGVDVAFGLPGAHIDSILQDALDAKLRIVDVRHEMNAGHAAEGYARVTGRLGVAVVTAGGGFTNVLTSITNAYLDRTPVLYLAGSGPLERDETNDQQAGFDQVAMAAPVTRYAHRVTRAELIPRLLAQAIRTALSEPRGPVLLDIPWDVLRQQVDADQVDEYRVQIDGTGTAPADAVDRIVEALHTARRPIALVGKSFVTADARAQLHELATRASVPLLSDWEGLGAIVGSEQHVGLVQTLATLDAHERPDLVLLLGLRFGMTTQFGTGKVIAKDARIFQIDPDGRELGRLQEVELGIQADPIGTVRLLNERLGDRPGSGGRDDWLTTLRDVAAARRSALAAETEAHSGAIHPYLAVRVIAESVPEQATVLVDGALTELWLAETIALAPLAHYLGHGYLSSMGSNFGVALGAQYATGDNATILVTGDGAVGYSLAEFDSLVRAGLPVIVIVLNNRAWGATLHTQQFFYGPDRVTNNRLENGSYSGVARALGADGVDVTELEQLRPAIEAALAARRPTCIDVRVSLEPIPPEERVMNGEPPFGGVDVP
jgi:acetolactate synthase-1/2/3 large subunit